MCTSKPMFFCKFMMLLICTCVVTILYVSDKYDHPNCLWNGAKLHAMNYNGSSVKSDRCKYGSCDKQICNFIHDINVLSVSIEYDNTFPIISPKLIGKDYAWITIIIILFLITIIDLINMVYIIYPKHEDFDVATTYDILKNDYDDGYNIKDYDII